MDQQRALLTSLLSGRRFHQMMDAEVVGPEGAYTAMEFLTDVQDGVWSELKGAHPQIDVCRRKLQRAYLEHLKNEMYPKDAVAARPIIPGGDDTGRLFGASNRDTDFRAVARVALKDLADRLGVAVQQTKDPMTLAHLQDCKHEVEQILNPKN
jgi:hypothetical protein